MKAFQSIFTYGTVAALVAVSQAAEIPAALASYDFPTGNQAKLGYAVVPAFTEKFATMQKSVIEKLNAISDEKRKAFMEKYDPATLIAYDAELWASQEEYAEYKKEWQNTPLQGQAQVAVSLRESGDGNWCFFTVANNPTNGQQTPITISALEYNPEKNVWLSSHGELTATEFKATEDFIFKAQTGTEWKLVKEDSFAKTTQMLRVAKTTDGKAVYLYYAFAEQSKTTGAVLAQQGYTLIFPVQQAQMNIGNPGSR